MNILVQYCRTDKTREWLDSSSTTRTIRTGRQTMVYESYRSGNCISLVRQHFNLHSTTRTTRTGRTGRETIVYESYSW